MFRTLITAASFALIAQAHGATGIFGSHVEIFTTTATVYRGESFGSTPDFQGASLGTFTTSDTLIFGQAQINTFKNGGSDVTGGQLQYRVYEAGSSPGSFSTQTFSFQANASFTDIAGNSVTGGGDQAWGNTDDIDLLALTSGNGDYEVEIFFQAFTNEGDRFSNNGGNNFKATFTVVPEPSIALLGSLGLLGLLRRRR